MNTQKRKYANKYYFGGNREKAILRDGGRCVKCGITRDQHREKYNHDITVDHIDGRGCHTPKKEKNNSLENLQTLCMSCHGKKDIAKSTRSAQRIVLQINSDGELIKRWNSIMDAAREGYTKSRITEAAQGKHATYRGYKWQYVV